MVSPENSPPPSAPKGVDRLTQSRHWPERLLKSQLPHKPARPPNHSKRSESEEKEMIKPSGRVLRIAVIASLIVGSSFAIHAQFQDDAPGKMRAAQNTKQRQAEGRPAPEVTGYWQALAARSVGPLAVSWNRRTGTPESIHGKLSGPMGDASEMTARHFLAENASLFKMNSATDDLELSRSHE